MDAEHLGEAAKWVIPRAARVDVRRESAFVYVIQAGALGPVKIGWAHDPLSRRAEFQTGNHQDLQVILAEDLNDRRLAMSVESDLHRTYAHLRIRGEWFRYEGSLRSAIWDCYYGDSIMDHCLTGQSVRRNVELAIAQGANLE